ncbi:MAG: hypothetical protein ACXVBP_06715 [Flavisolibacter sp.]
MLAFMVLLVILCSCASSKITSSWKAPGILPATYGKIMVVGIIREADRTLREQMEDHMVGDLKDLGYTAFSSFKEYGPKAFENVSEEEVNKKLAGDGIDAVLTIVLLDKQKERYYVPRRVVYSPYITYHSHFYGYYRSIYTRIDSPDYYDETTRYFWESNFYQLEPTSKLLYSVQTQSFDPSSTQKLAHEYGKMIVQHMEKNNILGRQPEKTIKAM